jgi:tryptophan synthase beta chain
MTATDRSDPATLGSFYGDLERLLVQQLKERPGMHDLRLKLLELYYETNRGAEFHREAKTLSVGFDRRAHAADWKRVCSMAKMLGIDDPLLADQSGDSIEFVAAVPTAAATKQQPKHRRFGDDEQSKPRFQELTTEYEKVRADPRFLTEFDLELIHMAARPSALFHARRLSKKYGGAQLFFKREDLAPPATRLTISITGQALFARRLGKTTLVTASSNGLKGVVAASIAARLGLRAMVFMDESDIQRQSSQVFRMKLLGAIVTPVHRKNYAGNDVRNAALEAWVRRPEQTFLLMGLDAAPLPYPLMSREFAAVIGRETKRQVMVALKRVPDLLLARAGNNADAIGFFEPFLADAATRLMCVDGVRDLGGGKPAREKSHFDPVGMGLTDAEKRVAGAILEGLEYPSVTREHAFLKASGRIDYAAGNAMAARKAIVELAQQEGIVPAIETASVVAVACDQASRMKPEQAVVVMLAESGDKDIWEISRALGEL